MRDNEILGMTIGGTEGGVRLTTGLTGGDYDLIIVEAGTTLSVLEDEAANDLLIAKNLGSFAFTEGRLLSAGTGHTIKKVSFTGGAIWGYK